MKRISLHHANIDFYMQTTKEYSITVLRVLCAIQVFFIHFFAGHNLREYIWLFDVAVPSFILVSGYLYGLRKVEPNFNLGFLKRRWIALSCVFYPYIFVKYIILIFRLHENIFLLFKSFIFDIFYLNTFAINGADWFMQTILYCYISLFICQRFRFLDKIFKNKYYALLLFLLVIGCGFIYRGFNVVYIYAYLLVYYNAKRIKIIGEKYFSIVLPLLISLYVLDSLRYLDDFHYGIYLNYMHRCVMGIMFILLVSQLFAKIKENKLVSYLGLISFEFFLAQYFFAYDYPLYICLPCTLLLAVLFHYVGNKNKLFLQYVTKSI